MPFNLVYLTTLVWLSTDAIQNAWKCTYRPAYAFMAWCLGTGTTLPLTQDLLCFGKCPVSCIAASILPHQEVPWASLRLACRQISLRRHQLGTGCAERREPRRRDTWRRRAGTATCRRWSLLSLPAPGFSWRQDPNPNMASVSICYPLISTNKVQFRQSVFCLFTL
jgi:hypothetical protein